MTIKDPREKLVSAGNALLDTFYRKHQWSERNATLEALVEQGLEASDEAVQREMKKPGFMEAVLERLMITADMQKLMDEYIMLRSTIEALEAPRATMFPTAFNSENGEER